MSAFSISVNTVVPLQSFAAMELVSSDRERESLVIPCGRPCGDLCPCLEKVDKQTDLHPFCPVWGDSAKTAFQPCWQGVQGSQNGGNRGWLAGSKCVQVKGRVAFASPLARKTPLGKAVREKKMPPRDRGYCKIGWHRKRMSRKQGVHVGGMDTDRER